MKTSQFKQLIKEAVREAIQEELKDILLEAIKTPKQQIVKEIVKELYTPPVNNNIPQKQFDPLEMKNKYLSVLDGMKEKMMGGNGDITLTTEDLKSMGPIDPVNGGLPEGSLSLDSIAGLLNKK